MVAFFHDLPHQTKTNYLMLFFLLTILSSSSSSSGLYASAKTDFRLPSWLTLGGGAVTSIDPSRSVNHTMTLGITRTKLTLTTNQTSSKNILHLHFSRLMSLTCQCNDYFYACGPLFPTKLILIRLACTHMQHNTKLKNPNRSRSTILYAALIFLSRL